jgi:hypothetical protein
MSNLFLNNDEIAELTGIRKAKNGQSRYELQARQLRIMHVPFWVNAAGIPKVARAIITGAQIPSANSEEAWTPKPLRLNGQKTYRQ